MKIIILSAGQGRRLMPLTEERPKCALDVAGQPILARQLDAIDRCPDIEDVIVVTGFATDKVEKIVQDFPGEYPRRRTLFNPFFNHCDNLGTCWVARHEMDGPFILVNGDTLFSPPVLQRLLEAPAAAPITVTIDRKPVYDDDDMKVIDTDGRLQQVGKQLDRTRVTGESIGMTRFDDEGAALFRAELERSMRFREGKGLWYLSAIDTLARHHRVGVCPIEGLGWCEVDTPEDLENAGQAVNQWRHETAPGETTPPAFVGYE